jgi:uncharacterized membrane protein YkvA (DUF1232 family)
MSLSDTKINFEKEQSKYEGNAREYITNPQKTDGLLKKAILKAKTNKGSLGDAWGKLQLFFDLVKDYSKGNYRNVSTKTILTVIGAILYFVSPLDVVPDFLVGLGIVDDAAVIGYTLKKLSREIEEYQKWKNLNPITVKSPFD